MSIDKINIFQLGGDVTDDTQDPLYPEYLQLVEQYEALKDMPAIPGGYPDAPSFAKFKQQKAREQAIQTMTGALDEGDVKKAYEEGFTQLPIGEQLLHYINPITGVPIETYETGYFTKKGGLDVKSPQEILIDYLNPNKNIAQKTFLKADDPLSAAIAPLSALGALGGAFELANIPKAALIGISRRMNQRAMDGGGGGGGISDLPKPQQETTKDLAGYKSNVYEEAKSVEIDSGQALLDYLTSPKRQNPSNNKSGIALKKSEIDEIDFNKFKEENPGGFTKEQLLQYINDNRIQLYSVRRSTDPDIRPARTDSEDLEFYPDEPANQEIYDEARTANYDRMFNTLEDQTIFFTRNFGPEGIITPQTYQNYLDRALHVEGEKILRDDFVKNIAHDINDPFYEVDESAFIFIRPDGMFDEDMSLAFSGVEPEETIDFIEDALTQGFTIQPTVLGKNYDVADLADRASLALTDKQQKLGAIDEVYRYVTDDDVFEIIGSSEGYRVRRNGESDYSNFGEDMSFAEAKLQVGQYIDREYDTLGDIDNYNDPANLIDVAPDEVIYENASLPVKYPMDDFRLAMGGADDYEEYTIHIKNPKTTTRYSGVQGNKHFGGGDELFHLRTTIRTDENGKKVLFVEEIQSDLHSTARSTQTASTYELPPKEKQKINEQLNNIFQDLGITGERTNKGDFVFKNKQGKNQSLDSDDLPFIAREIRAGKKENFGSKGANAFVDTFGLEKTQEIGDMLAKVRPSEGAFFMDGKLPNLPDFPYKKDWVDLAVKEAMKIGAEKNVDRVAFTNAATQIDRNSKRLNYVQDKVITEVPTEKEILDSVKFADLIKNRETLAYEDFVRDPNSIVSNFKSVTGQESRFLDMPVPTKNEFFADMPNKRKRMKVLETQEKNITNEMYQKFDDDLTRFMQEYPEVSKEFIVAEAVAGELDKTARGVLNAYEKMSEAELTELGRRANVDLDLISDPRNIDVTNPALARLLDADLKFREIPQFQTDKIGELRYIADEKNYLRQFLEHDPEKIRENVLRNLKEEYGTGRYKYKLEDVGYRLEGDEILNPRKIELVGDDYDTMRINTRMLTDDEELLEKLPKNLREQVKKDLAAGKKEITLNINNTEGSGKKFEEIYKNEIPRGINKVLKELKVKDVKPNISNVLYAEANPYNPIDRATLLERWKNREIDGELLDAFPKGHSSIGIDLTDEMKRKILQEGLNNMYMGGKVSKSNSMDKPIAGNVREM